MGVGGTRALGRGTKRAEGVDWKEVGKPAGPEPVGPNCI